MAQYVLRTGRKQHTGSQEVVGSWFLTGEEWWGQQLWWETVWGGAKAGIEEITQRPVGILQQPGSTSGLHPSWGLWRWISRVTAQIKAEANALEANNCGEQHSWELRVVITCRFLQMGTQVVVWMIWRVTLGSPMCLGNFAIAQTT